MTNQNVINNNEAFILFSHKDNKIPPPKKIRFRKFNGLGSKSYNSPQKLPKCIYFKNRYCINQTF